MLDQALSDAPLVLPQEHSAKFSESSRRIVQRAKDALPVPDGEGEDGDLPLQCLLEHGRGGLVDDLCELSDKLGADGDPGEHHRAERTHVRVESEIPSIESVLRNRDEGTTRPAVTQPGEGSCGLARHKPTASSLLFTYPRAWHGLGAA